MSRNKAVSKGAIMRALAKRQAQANAQGAKIRQDIAQAQQQVSEGGKVLRLSALMCCVLHALRTDPRDDDPQVFVPLEAKRIPTQEGRQAVLIRAHEAVDVSMAWGMHCARKANGIEWPEPANDTEWKWGIPGLDSAQVQPVFPAGWNASIYGEAA